MNPYDKWRHAMHLSRQASQRFGKESAQHIRCRNVGTYWWTTWQDAGGKVIAPEQHRLEEYIKGAEKQVRYHKRINK